jgi:hypothetical protein
MFSKGKMIKRLKAAGIRRTSEGKKLELVKTFKVIDLYFDTFGGFND